MDILLTGASGFLGRNYLLRAPENWRILAIYRQDASFPRFVAGLQRPHVTALQCDLADPLQVAALTRKYGREWESCLYLSAKVDIPWSVREPQRDLLANTVPLLNLLDAIHARRLVYLSSGAVYDGLRCEVDAHLPIAPTLPYAISKLACERYVEFYHRRRQSVDEYMVVRFFGAYGPYEAAHKIYTRLVRAFAFEGRNRYTIYGDGRNLIDAMYVDDAIDAIQRILTGRHWNAVINLASGHPVPVEALVREAGEALGVSAVSVEKDGVANENIEFWASVRDLRSWYGFEPRIPLSQGLPHLRDFLAGETKGAELLEADQA
jgi:nucleoside-diphosphate-sugar epimerase